MPALFAAQILPGFSGLAVASMIASIVLMLGFVITSLFFLHRRYRAEAKDLLFGSLTYVLFIFLGLTFLSSLIWMIPGLREAADAAPALGIVIDTVINTLELPILLLILNRKAEKNRGVVHYLEFGLGYGVVEMMVVAMYSVGVAFMLHMVFRVGGDEGMLAYMGEGATEADLAGVLELMNMPWYLFLASTVEALLMLIFRIGTMETILGIQYGKLPKGQTIGLLTLTHILVHAASVSISHGVLPGGPSDILLMAALLIGCAYVWLTAKKALMPAWAEEKAAIGERKKAGRHETGIGEKVRYSGLASRREKHAAPHDSDQGF